MAHAIVGECERGAVDARERAFEDQFEVRVIPVGAFPLKEVHVACEAFVHGLVDFFLQLERLQFGRDDRRHHQAFGFGGCVAVARD